MRINSQAQPFASSMVSAKSVVVLMLEALSRVLSFLIKIASTKKNDNSYTWYPLETLAHTDVPIDLKSATEPRLCDQGLSFALTDLDR